MTNEMAMACIIGQMAEFMKEIGSTTSSMGSEFTKFLMKKSSLAFGRKVSEKDGSALKKSSKLKQKH